MNALATQSSAHQQHDTFVSNYLKAISAASKVFHNAKPHSHKNAHPMAPHNGQLTQNLREEHRTLKTLLNRAHQAMLSNEWGPATRTLLQLQSLMNEHLMQEHLQLYAHVLWSEQVSTGYKAAIRKHQGEMNLLFSRTSQLLSRLLHLKPEGRPEALREFCELKVLWIEGLVREELDLFLVYDSLHLHPEVEMA